MKYSTVQIRPSPIDRNDWDVSFADLDGDRTMTAPGPHSLGFYHYPTKLGRAKAFAKLRDYLLKKHDDEIDALQKSRAKLRNLEYAE